jgi:SNF2 family DNA or RNA helicase
LTRKQYTPREYGGLITDHITSLDRCAVFASMGMGKTVCTLTAIDSLILAGETQPTLITAPLRVAKTTWPSEVQKWEHLRGISVIPIIGNEAERRMALKFDAAVYTTNYENLPWLVEYYGDRWPFRRVVVDESTKLKSFRLRQGGQRAQSLGKVAHSKIKSITELTGTPAPNGLIDLWGQMWFIDRGVRLGRTFESYKERWFRQSPDGYGLLPLPHAQAEIEEKLRDVCLTVDAADWFDLDEPIVNTVYVDLPAKVRKLYRDMEKELFMQFDGHEVEAFNAAAKSQKLLQLASGAVYLDPAADNDFHPKAKEWKEVHDEKLQALDDIIEEAGGMPILVAYHFKSDLARLQRTFPKGRVLDANTRTIEDWNAGKIPLLFAHPASAGHGLNLQDGGNILVYFSHDWNLENRQQILERIGPMRQMQSGHNRPVFVYNIVARDTLDEAVIERTEGKATVQAAFMNAMKRRQ